MSLADLLQLTNTVLEAAVVILIASVLLYGIGASIRSRIARASNLLLLFTVIAYIGDLMLTQVATPADMERWLRLEWVGIAFVPGAYLQLADSLMELTGGRSGWRRLLSSVAYALGAVTLALSAFSDLIVRGQVINLDAPQLRPGPLFPLFAVLFGALIAAGAFLQIQARNRSRTATTRHRITYLIASAGGPVVSVFPYLAITGQQTVVPPVMFWTLQIIGNGAVALTISFMTYAVAYFGGNEPERVIRLRLVKFLARGPLVAIGVLVALVAVARAGKFLGLTADRATPFIVVAGIVIFQWVILLIKPSLERLIYFDEQEDVIRLQELRDRLQSPRDLRQYLENVIAEVCQLFQVDTGFVASYGGDGRPQVELIVGQISLVDNQLPAETPYPLARAQDKAKEAPPHFVWDGFWLYPLYESNSQTVLGILGVASPTATVKNSISQDLAKAVQLQSLTAQAAAVLGNRRLQAEVLAAMAGLLRKVDRTHRQMKRRVPDPTHIQELDDDLTSRSDYLQLVRDALNHYWGGPKLTGSPLLQLRVVQEGISDNQGNPINAMRSVLLEAIETLRPEGNRSMTTAEWILYNILELKFLKRYRVRDIARRLAMSESDLYRKQRVAIEAVARVVAEMEQNAKQEPALTPSEDARI